MTTMIDRLKAAIRDFGIEYFGRWYGWYPGEVTSNSDPQNQGRVKVKVPMIQLDPRNDEIPNFAYPVFGPFTPGQDKGSYNVPRVGDKVWVSFRNGNLSNPLYQPGGFFAKGERPSEFESTEDRGWKTHAGHVVRFRDQDGDESILIQHTTGAKVEMDSENKVVIETNAGDTVVIDPAGSILVRHRAGTRAELKETDVEAQASANAKVQAPNITLQGGNVQLAAPGAIHPVPKGDILMTWLSSFHAWAVAHTHITIGNPLNIIPLTPAGPTTPAVPPAPPPPVPLILSTKTKTG